MSSTAPHSDSASAAAEEEPVRGRARSRSFISEDDEDDPLGLTGRTPRRKPRRPPPTHPKPGLSQKTLDIVNDLSGQVMRGSTSGSEEEEAAEMQLAESERQRLRAAPAPAASAAVAAAAAPASGAMHAMRRGEEDANYDVYIKLLMLGDSGVGKTSFMLRYSDDTFEPSLLATAGVDYKVKFLDVDGKRVKCQVWDTAGQERFHVITRAYYRGAHGIVLVYDTQEEKSFSNVGYWMNNIQCHASPTVEKILVGNKIDMPDKKIDTARGQAAADKYGIKLFETSAKDGTNVEAALMSIARDIVRRSGGTAGPGSAARVEVQPAAGVDGKKRPCAIL